MDNEGLPLVGSGVDYEKVCAIEQKRTIAFLNHYVMHTSRFLNRFSNTCEEKLETISARIDRLDTVLKNLESKLNSVPGLENVSVSDPSSQPGPSTSTTNPQSQPSSQPQPQTSDPSSAAPQPQPEPEPEVVSAPISKDPRFEKYFKMLNMGVPAAAVQTKMRVEGVDPAILDTPNAPAPPMSGKPASADNDNSDDGFSDSDTDLSD